LIIREEHWKVASLNQDEFLFPSEISDFAVKTPFELPQLVEGSKRLLDEENDH
jgi:hypothetical protein